MRAFVEVSLIVFAREKPPNIYGCCSESNVDGKCAVLMQYSSHQLRTFERMNLRLITKRCIPIRTSEYVWVTADPNSLLHPSVWEAVTSNSSTALVARSDHSWGVLATGLWADGPTTRTIFNLNKPFVGCPRLYRVRQPRQVSTIIAFRWRASLISFIQAVRRKVVAV